MRFVYKFKGKKVKPVDDLRHLVRSAAEQFGDKTLYVYKNGRETARYSYNTLNDEMNCIGTALAKLSLLGCGAAVTGNTHPRWITSYLAVVNGGGYIVPLDSEVTAEQTRNFIERSKSKVIFYTASQNEKMAEIAPFLDDVKLFIPINPEGDFRFSDKVITIDEFIEAGREQLEAGNTEYLDCELDIDKMCAILFTSGTTGTSKGVMLSQRNLTAAVNAAVQTMPFDDTITSLSVLPLHHSYELTCEHLSCICLGSEMFINDSLKNLKRNISSYKPDGLVLVPVFIETLYKRIWDEARKNGREKKLKAGIKLSNALLFFGIDLRNKFFGEITAAFGGNMHTIISGGAPLSPDIIKNFYSLGITIFEGFGITECAPLVSVNSPQYMKLRSVGRPVQCCEVKIGEDREGNVGEILVKGDNVMLGYYEDPEATREAFTPDGWFNTGDMGYLDKDGFIYITGRKKNIIIMGNGKNIYPEELEEYLYKIDLIEECVVVERQNEGNPVLVALVVPDEERTEGMADEEIYNKIKEEVDYVNSLLPSYKFIYDIELRHEKFERNTSRKIMRHKVR